MLLVLMGKLQGSYKWENYELQLLMGKLQAAKQYWLVNYKLMVLMEKFKAPGTYLPIDV